MTSSGQGKAAERWVKEFATASGILAKIDRPLEQVVAKTPLQRQVAVAEKAIQDGFGDRLDRILACDPHTKKIAQQQGEEKVRYHIGIIVRAVSLKNKPLEQPRESLKSLFIREIS
ncbi:hypothetical protein NIES593_08285 [Hydrococcus rivularis NIES-593]|uniref:Uncharacterized protein n=1 Tax=Hydrococcus rivularis NIES-593 TaxID=1921803 RepID=A0A1U7HKU0_9CYAN|nr:hypothetical protein [Hydrococcus rivularis]OKH24145.1 hypothetical protein NIES593_08285 [Hydrococcus rivularis NIES-593]